MAEINKQNQGIHYLYCTYLASCLLPSLSLQTLETNVSLSSGYLETLSLTYKKQIEDLQQSYRQTTDEITAVKATRKKDAETIENLVHQVKDLTNIVRALSTQQETMVTWVRMLVK